ncbi:MAG: hypothetical protein E7037_03520, partial [Verrucomicrobia bacterium]|nr:hypothetical protein [Verrucomicrobiota bacterium]
IGGNALSLYSANGNYVGSAPLSSSGGGGSGGSGNSGGSGSSGSSGSSGTGTGGAGTGTGGAGTLPETVQELEFSALGGSVPLRVNHSQTDRDIIEGANAEWIAVSDEFFGAEIKRNTEKTPRTGTLKIRHETLVYYGERSEWVAASRTIYNITQRGIFYVEPETLQIPCEGGEASVEFKNGVPVGVDKGFAESAGTDGKILVPANPICVFCDGAQVYAFDIIWTAESTETFTQRVEIAAPGTTARTLTVSPEETATSGGNVTVAASHPENETCDLSAGSAYAASLVSLTKNAGKTEAVYSLPPAPANTRITFLALFTAAANCRNAHTGILSKSVVFRGEESGGEDTGTGGGENSGTEGNSGEAGDSGENPGDGDEPETPPPGEELSLTGDRSRFTCEASRLTLTATATAGIDLSAAQLFIPDDASEWITVIGTPVTDGNTKAWTLLITANFTERERAAALAVYAGTLAAAFRISQKYFPRRAAAFYRNKRLWKPTFFNKL